MVAFFNPLVLGWYSLCRRTTQVLKDGDALLARLRSGSIVFKNPEVESFIIESGSERDT